MAEPVDAPMPGSDPREVDLPSQIDALSLALQDWRRTREFSPAVEDRLVQITFQCARMIESWQQIERTRTASVGVERLPDTGDRLHLATGERLRALERHIEHEWNSLPDRRSNPGRQIGEPAQGLASTRVGAAGLALREFASVESRLAALEQDVQAGMAQLSRDLQAVVSELRSARSPAPKGTPSAFPLEGVMRIHDELRESDAKDAPAPAALDGGAPRALPQGSEAPATTALVARVESLERAVSAADPDTQPRRGWRVLYSVAGLVVLLTGLALFGLWMQRRVDARLEEAALQVAAAERQRDATVAAAREQAAQDVADARQSAAQAQIVGNVLAAPDLVRYWLVGADGDSRRYAQVMFSRSRGMVFSATRLEQPGDGQTYQLWLLTQGGPVNAGLIAPDEAGRVTFATDVPLTVSSRLTGALVTLEPEGGQAAPSGAPVLVRAE